MVDGQWRTAFVDYMVSCGIQGGSPFNVTLQFNNGTSANASGHFSGSNAGGATGLTITRNSDAKTVKLRYSAQQ